MKIEHWMNENFLKLYVIKSQLLICGKTTLIKVHQTKVVQLKASLHIDCNSLETSMILKVQGVHKVLHTFKILISQKPHMVETIDFRQ